ncbi:site-specific DNA-methyltransferase [Paenibacillus alvei]|nr:site-specific DNA-methyltransferase [Paenibacillus alvei]MCY9543367.1 site-specific DNA-methyltransferase [Paenibacillus alvei]MCY9704753.1 site-specific DNA-methyltransferase [Paenibacillus alvei]MCY9733694.1 site-specific DNA-methyltransferase [Paenibacillus alvei]MCY9755515.1 site-specific DNA-methyltransferase [Paenibacillus alvei]MEC0082066.1 site-specific DNA-methyltransferase [Paenibacillus alvei]
MQSMNPEQFHTCVTSPPYWALRDYGVPPSDWPEVTYTPMTGMHSITVPSWTGCLGLEPTIEMFVAHMVLIFRGVWRVLRKDGTLWLNFGDSFAGSGKGAWRNKERQKETYIADPDSPQCKVPKLPSGLKSKDLVGIPWRVAFALQADGWYLRMDNIWNKPNCMPESVRDRPTKAHEYVFLFSKSDRYYYDAEAIKEPLASSSIKRLSQDIASQAGSTRANGGAKKNGNMKAVGGSKGAFGQPQSRNRSGNKERKYGDQRDRPNSHLGTSVPWEGTKRNKRSVWTVATSKTTDAHFATFPEMLIEPCILAGSPAGGKVFDPFGGSGTTEKVSIKHHRKCTSIEINPAYIEIAEKRNAVVQTVLNF